MDSDSNNDEEKQESKVMTSKFFKRRIRNFKETTNDDDDDDDQGSNETEDIDQSDSDDLEIQTLPIRRKSPFRGKKVRPPEAGELEYTTGSYNQSATGIPEASLVKELKERRYRKQTKEFEAAKEEERQEDYDSDFRRNKQNEKDSNDDEDSEMEVDRDEKLSDGRLALSTNEEKVQKLIKRKEIEEALFELEEESTSDSEKNEGVSSGSDSVLKEVFESVAPKHFLKKDIIDSLEAKYPMPRLKKVPPLEICLQQMQKRLQNLQQIQKLNRKKKEQIDTQLHGLRAEEGKLAQKLQKQ
ncbi:hypothetical protein FOA43_003716 [Brettanomyces nanus]|uniref:Uncharacterized protein n=1 Tax=Eeniella nana TaxID=13502 RepID=A0A875RQA3_EENNA|nr:uncharacterized protein FOA43_003716 [Brettanomyces nanus]QPG76330.1 hypothetical protein FOA43_003716 [Brettanomyces nanus]